MTAAAVPSLYGLLGAAGVVVFAVGALMSIVAHEVAHGWASDALGDPTPRRAGRLTLNPIKHLTVWGVLVPVLLARMGLPAIGWAKPVPVDPRHYPDPRRGLLLVALAGPAANVAIAVLLSPIVALVGWPEGVGAALVLVLVVNLALALFNMVPVPPLDGSKVLQLAMPRAVAWRYLAAGRTAIWVMLGLWLFLPGAVSGFLAGLFSWAFTGAGWLLGLWAGPGS